MAKVKRGLVLHTLAGFLAIWLVFAGAVSGLLIWQTQERTDAELETYVTKDIPLWTSHTVNDPLWTPSPVVAGYLSDQMNALCMGDSRVKAGAVFRRHGDFGMLAKSGFPFGIVIEISGNNGVPRTVVTRFPAVDFMTNEQWAQLIALMAEYRERWETDFEEYQKQFWLADEEPYAAENIVLYASGWIRDDTFYPDRLIASRQTVTPGRLYSPDPCEVDEETILLDFPYDAEAIYDFKPGWKETDRHVENVQVMYDNIFYWDGTPVSLEKCRAALNLLRGGELRAICRSEAKPVSDLDTVSLTEGLPRGQRMLYTQYDDLEYAFLVETHTVRELLPILAGIWAASLLFTLLAGGLVCRGMCRVYDRQAALEQNRRDTSNALAHDLKTPLALIRGYTENLQFGIRPEKHAHYLAQIWQETERMDGILGGFLELSKLEAGTFPLHREPLQLRSLAEEYAERYRTAAELQHITLSVEGGGNLSADRDLFGRALDNLLSNALRHTPEGGTIMITVSPTGLTVENTGTPIPPEMLPHLFEAYYIGDHSRSGGKRHGLGLAIVRAIAERHGMEAIAENTPSGVRFRLTRL